MNTPINESLVVIGGGNMARAILLGALDAGVLDPRRVVVAEPDTHKHDPFTSRAIACTERAAQAIALADKHFNEDTPQLLLAVKPQVLDAVAAEIAPALDPHRRHTVVSILAGATSERIRAALDRDAAIVRVMPNTPAQVRRGMSAIALGQGARRGDETAARALFNAVGETIDIDESMMDAYTALAGSGPAYLFYLAEAMALAAIHMGFSDRDADRIVRATVRGSAELLASSDQSPSDLRSAVTSKGGTTEAATRILDESGVMDAFTRAIHAARDRGAQLANP